jgi:hypothetical protein
MAIPPLLSGVPKASHRVPDKMHTRSLRLGAILRVGKKMKNEAEGKGKGKGNEMKNDAERRGKESK